MQAALAAIVCIYTVYAREVGQATKCLKWYCTVQVFGKSWYTVVRTLLAPTSRQRETLTGDATLRFFDFLGPFAVMPGVFDNLHTEVSSSTARDFECVDFVDTPGLVDGDTTVW